MFSSELEILRTIETVSHPGRLTTLLAIDGCGGSGKSTLAANLARHLGGVSLIHCDDLSANPSHPEWRNRLKIQVIEPLLSDIAARYARYDWKSGELLGWSDIQPGGVVVVEGVSTLHSDLGDPWDVSIWVQCSREIRLARGISRDGESMRVVWTDQWMPDEDEYVNAERPQDRAHLIYDGSGST